MNAPNPHHGVDDLRIGWHDLLRENRK
jgi:hypothetical protein